MRQIFTAHPYIAPREPEEIALWCRQHGTPRKVSKGEVLKYGGEGNRLFFVESGLCAYYIAGELTGAASIMSLLPPGCTIGDLTTTVNTQCNVLSRAIADGVVYVCPPAAYREMLNSSPTLLSLKLRHTIFKEEGTLEGMIANFTLPPEMRLKVLFKSLLLDCADIHEGQSWYTLPYRLSDETLGQVVNLKRQTVSSITSQWRREGLLKKIGHDREVHISLFDNLYDWLERPDSPKPDWSANNF